MTNPPDATRRHGATVAQLDILELLRSGALPAYPATAPEHTVELELPPLDASDGDVIDLTDREGVPIARVPVKWVAGVLFTSGRPTWLGKRSTRPFEGLHRCPRTLTAPSDLIVLSGPTPAESVRTALGRSGTRPLLLVLESLDGDIAPSAVENVRRALDVAAEESSVTVVVAPVPTCLGPAERNAVLRAYANGSPIHQLDGHRLPPGTAGPLRETGLVLFFTGLSGSGKSTLARAVRNQLLEKGERVTLLDGDVVRRHLSAGLGFSPVDRDTNVRRIGWVAAEVAHHGGVAICSPIAPFESIRQAVRQMAEARGTQFMLVHVATPLDECERRDRKGLYAQARRGEIPEFTGISSPYEVPGTADLRIDTTGQDVDHLAARVLAMLEEGRA